MRSTLEALQRDIEEIQAMASAIKPANDLLAQSTNSAVRRYLAVRRRFDYSAVMVALYASLERFVEDIVISYAETTAKRDGYASLPERLVSKHLQKTAELLARGRIDQTRYPGVTPHQLVGNLFGCLSGTTPYTLNPIAIAAHDKNIRYTELQSLLNVVDISHDAVRRADSLVDWYIDEQKITGARPVSVPATVVQQRLDDLVARRNDVAHRGGNPTDRLGVDEMRSLVDFVLALCRSVFALFVSHYLRKWHVGTSRAELLKLSRGPLQKKRVWVVNPPFFQLRVSQPVFALSPDFLARWGRVQNLRIGSDDHVVIDPGGSHPVGVMLDFAAPAGAELYVIAGEDEVIWPAIP
jgi:hypothetical protein